MTKNKNTRAEERLLNPDQQEFVTKLMPPIERATSFIKNVLPGMVEVYGSECLAPAKLPFDYLLDVATIYLEISSAISCDHCRDALDIENETMQQFINMGFAVQMQASTAFLSAEGEDGRFWYPEDLREARESLPDVDDGPEASPKVMKLIEESSYRYLTRLLFETAARIVERDYALDQVFPEPAFFRGCGHQAYQPFDEGLPEGMDEEEVREQMILAQDIVREYLYAEEEAEGEDGNLTLDIMADGKTKPEPGGHYH